MAVSLTSSELQERCDVLYRFVTAGGSFVAAFDGVAGTYVVYRPSATRVFGGAFFLCTLRDHPTLIEIDGKPDWVDHDRAIAAARALATGALTATSNDVALTVTTKDCEAYEDEQSRRGAS